MRNCQISKCKVIKDWLLSVIFHPHCRICGSLYLFFWPYSSIKLCYWKLCPWNINIITQKFSKESWQHISVCWRICIFIQNCVHLCCFSYGPINCTCDFSKASIICNYILNFTVNITNVFVLLLSVLFLENQKAQLRFYLFILFIFKLDFDT